MFKTIGVSLLAIAIASSARAQQIGDVFYIALENHNFTQPSTVTAALQSAVRQPGGAVPQ